MRILKLFALLIFMGCRLSAPPGLPCRTTEFRSNPFLKRLVRHETIAEAEARHQVKGVAFGYLASEWVELKSRMLPEDQLWWFEREPGRALQGALEGYVVLRGCKVVDQLTLVTD